MWHPSVEQVEQIESTAVALLEKRVDHFLLGATFKDRLLDGARAIGCDCLDEAALACGGFPLGVLRHYVWAELVHRDAPRDQPWLWRQGIQVPTLVLLASLAAYQHDCEDCRFLGATRLSGRREELYWCPRDKTAIHRHGSEGAEYTSFPAVAPEEYRATSEACRRAEVLGLPWRAGGDVDG
jgi:hypothetical protein